MDYSGIKDLLKNDIDRVNAVISDSLASEIALLDSTNKSILAHSGKQLRPVLALLVAKSCSGGVVTEDTIHYAAASELLHNATLLHDDVADNSSTRRGNPTVMSLLGGRASVLLGDYWLVKAMENILSSDNSSSRVIRLFSSTLSDLAEGELLQMQKAFSGDTVERDYLKIVYCKTASLFCSAAVSAAISVGAEEEKIKAAKLYATNLGIAFQIKDDIFDYRSDLNVGKPVGHDIIEKKITMPLLGALASASESEEKSVRRMIRDIDSHPDYQKNIMDFVTNHKGVDYAATRLDEYVAKAKIALRPLGEGRFQALLADIADFVSYRKS